MVTYSEARMTGARRYQGKPCHLGHSGERYTSTRSCIGCLERRHRENLEYYRAYAAMVRVTRADQVRGNQKRWRERHPEKCRENARRYRLRNADKIALQEQHEQAVHQETIRLLYYTREDA